MVQILGARAKFGAKISKSYKIRGQKDQNPMKMGGQNLIRTKMGVKTIELFVEYIFVECLISLHTNRQSLMCIIEICYDGDLMSH